MKSALLVIDAQKIYTDPESELYCEQAESTLDKINKLIKIFENTRQSIYLIRHIHKSDASDLGRMFDYYGESPDDFDFKEGTEDVEYDNNLYQPESATHLIKKRYSAFIGTDLLDRLIKEKIEKIVICGFMTNFCCESSARDAHDRDFFVDFIIDATGTPGTENLDQEKIREIVGELLDEGFAVTKTTSEFLAN